ncbi:MAG TPA: YpdA family putative bacillithiol disulfide reductase [Vicinamibacterales bacterium]|nr:YpdA family putative bacillithiol disulfide reductase [Vicinamibacterales bacterium]
MQIRDVIIVGGGPAGLATAIAAKKEGLDHLVLEKAALVNSLLHYPTNMVFFTTPELLEIGGMPFVSPNEKPTRQEALRYYRRVTDAYELDIAFDEQVVAVGREQIGGESLFVVDTRSAKGVRRGLHARAVVIASGAYDVANRLGVRGEDLPHVSHYYTEPHAYFRKPVVVVGGKNSAAEAALDLFRNGSRVTLVHRRATLGASIKYWVKPDIENRIAEGSIAALFDTTVVEIRPTTVVVSRADGTEEIPADAVFLLTGYGSDTALLHASGVDIDPATCGPVHNPETFETNVPGLFVVGAVVAGVQSGRIFIENGRFHGQVAVRNIVERLAQARRTKFEG